MPPKVRPMTISFDSDVMAQTLLPLANLKNPGFSWRGDSYQAHRRGLVASHTGLTQHAPILEKILATAKSGFPSFKSLKGCFESLHRLAKIYDDTPASAVDNLTTQSSDRFA